MHHPITAAVLDEIARKWGAALVGVASGRREAVERRERAVRTGAELTDLTDLNPTVRAELDALIASAEG